MSTTLKVPYVIWMSRCKTVRFVRVSDHEIKKENRSFNKNAMGDEVWNGTNLPPDPWVYEFVKNYDEMSLK
jgi:hypothetical protein